MLVNVSVLVVYYIILGKNKRFKYFMGRTLCFTLEKVQLG